MGLTIHYSARLKSRDVLPQLTDEVADICQSMGWAVTHEPFPLTKKMGDLLDRKKGKGICKI